MMKFIPLLFVFMSGCDITDSPEYHVSIDHTSECTKKCKEYNQCLTRWNYGTIYNVIDCICGVCK